MFFPLLEALLLKNPQLCKQRVREFFQSEEDLSPLFKSMFTYAAQHSLSENSGLDAVVLTDCLVNVIQMDQRPLEPDRQEILLGHGIDFLCMIPVETIDTSSLKPSREEAKVVSVYDLEEAFEKDDFDLVIKSVRDLLTLMDNKHYFMEIMYQIALCRSPRSLTVASATSRAIDILGWQNNFTPFLIFHLIGKLFHDKEQFEFSDNKSDVTDVFESGLSRIQSVSDLQFLSAAFYIHNDSKILADKIRAKIRMRLTDFFRSKETSDTLSIPASDRILYQSSIGDLQSVVGVESLRSKIHFAV